MVINQIKYKDPQSLNSIDAVFAEIERFQAHMQDVATTLTPEDIGNPEKMDWFTQQIAWMKGYYERIEVLIHG